MDPSHHENRRRLAALLPAGSLAVIATGRYAVACGVDSAAPWPDFFYLTGLRDPQCALILSSAQDGPAQTVLFTPQRSAQTELWEGPSGNREGPANVRPVTEFKTVLRALAHGAGTIYVFAPENPFAPHEDHTLAHLVRGLLPLHTLDRLAPLLGRLRGEKQAGEIENLRAANELAAKAFRRVMGFVRSGVRGFEVKAEFLHEIMRQGSAGFCCPAITAAGEETLTLHWRGDRRGWVAGETALLDFTCEWNGLCADVARCVPVGGRFSPRHRAVYDAVVRSMQSAIACVRPGRLLSDCERDIELILQHELLRLGLLKSAEVKDPAVPSPALRRHFMHRALHHVGLEVHDPVPAGMPLAPGQVIAVEPGIYVPGEGFGIRVENNVLITPQGGENLTHGLPVEAGEIESLLQI